MNRKNSEFAIVEREFESVKRYVKRMKEGKTFDEIDVEWRGFLITIEKVWNKIERSGVLINRGKFGKFQKPYKQFKKTDRLLTYVFHARNSDVHTISEIAEHYTNYSFTPISVVQHSLGNPSVHMGINPDRKPMIELDIKVELLSVKDRGRNYSPPWGDSIPGPMSPVEAADKVIEFYRGYINTFIQEFID